MFVSVAALTGDTRFDAAGSIAIGAVLISISAFIASRIKRLLVGTSAEDDVHDAIEEFIRRDPEIARLFNTITQQVGLQVMLAAKIQMRHGISIEAAVVSINALERRIRERFLEVGWCSIEPDFED